MKRSSTASSLRIAPASPARRRLLTGAAAGLGTLVLPRRARAEVVKIRVGYWPIAAGLPFYAAIEKGYFKDAGIDVEPLKFAGAQQVMEAMLSGRADGSANGTPCWKVSGTLDPALLTPLFGSTTATAPVPTTFCIGKSDNRLYSAALTCTIITGDKATTVHTFYLSKFGETVTVTPPPGN